MTKSEAKTKENQVKAYKVQIALVAEIQTSDCTGETVDINISEPAEIDTDLIVDIMETARANEDWQRVVASISDVVNSLKEHCSNNVTFHFTPFVNIVSLEEI